MVPKVLFLVTVLAACQDTNRIEVTVIFSADLEDHALDGRLILVLAADFLASTTDPYYAGEIDYGDRAEHCWNGNQERPNSISRLRYHQMYLDIIMERMKTTAPPSADMTSWRY